jgi:hypothetical protein
MALFQTSVLKKYLKALDPEKVNPAWNNFTSYFHNPAVQENIRAAKEEQFQSGFLRELFVKILGYTLYPMLTPIGPMANWKIEVLILGGFEQPN